MRRTATAAGIAVVAALSGACSSTGEPGHTAAVDVVVVDDDGVTQTVTAAGDAVDRVTVTTATFGEEDGVDGLLELEVRGGGQERQAAAAGSDLLDNAPVTLAFEPLTGSTGETLELTFTYGGQEPLALYRNPYDAYPDGTLQGADGDLVFVLGHPDRIGGALDAFGRVAREAAARATADPLFLAVWLLALAATTAAVLRLRAPAAPRDRDAASR